MALDPMRRRLTMSNCEAAKTLHHGEEVEDTLAKAGLKDIFELATENGTKAASIASVTDDELKKKPSNEEKATVCLSTFGNEEETKKWVASQGIGWSCRKGLKPEAPNQDSFSVLVVEGDFALYCVYDGHGPHGHEVSHFVRETVVKIFLGNECRTTDPGKAFEEAFAKGQEMLQEDSQPIDAKMSGTTCTMAYHDCKQDTLTVAHVGDSRAVLGRKQSAEAEPEAEDLTEDHKPNLPKERARIEGANGRVTFDGFYNYRVFAKDGLYPGLNMSRAIGDVIGHREAGLSAVPDVKVIDLREARKNYEVLTLVLCTDGIWEFISSAEAVKEVFNYSPAQAGEAMKRLVTMGWDLWMKDSCGEISDDITGILVDFPTTRS